MSEENPFNAAQIARFIEDGFLRLERAFPTGLADAGRAILQRDLAGRALLMLFLFSDVGEHDAPTRLRVGSHLTVAKVLAPEGDAGLTFMQLAPLAEAATAALPEALATGRAGDVLLCHPFLVHAAQAHRGTLPRFMAQPPLLARGAFDPYRLGDTDSPVEEAIRRGRGPIAEG